MGDTISIFTQLVVLFLVIGTGYGCKKSGLTSAAFDKGLSNLVLSVTLPAMILGSVLNSEELPSRTDVVQAFLFSCIAYLAMILVAMAVTALMRTPKNRRGVYRFMMVFGNVGFLGFPVVSCIWGDGALIYAAIFNLPFNFACFTVGAWFIASDAQGGEMERVTWRTFCTPTILSCAAAIALALLRVHNVPVLGAALEELGSMTTPAALLVIGSQLANLPLRELAGTPRLWATCLVRLLVMPALNWCILSLVMDDALMVGILVVTTAMPVANVGTMLCQKYDADTPSILRGTFLTTVLSLVTIPVLVTIMG